MTEAEEAKTNHIRDEASQAIAAALAAIGLTVVAASFLQAIAQRGQLNFEQELTKTLRRIVNEGLAEGWTADETAVQLAEAFHGVSSSTAQMLAQTELTTLVNERSLQAAQKQFRESSDPTYKTWQTMKDPRVRVAHATTQGQTVPISQPFNVGGYQMMYPGDPSAPLQLTARCRCRMTYTDSLTASEGGSTLMSMTETEELTAAVTITIDDESPAEDAAEPGEETQMGAPFKALLAVEGAPTEDGRLLDPGSISWRDLPLSLMAMDTTGPGGHEGARVAGRIDSIYRDGNDIWGEGFFNADEFGSHIESLVSNQSLRGNSIDLAVTAMEYRDANGNTLDLEGMMNAMMADEPVVMAVTDGVIIASTVCPTPAIGEANIMLAAGMIHTLIHCSWLEDQTLTAAGAGMAPLHPPLAWYENPNFNGPTALTVTPEGRVMGHAALWNSCHIGEPSGPGICVPPPRSGMQYEIFHHGVVTTAEGVDIPCGQITMSTFHAGRDLSWKQTLEHYEHSGCAVADVVAGEDRHGIWVSGGLRPDLPAERVREMKAGALSGDWRQVIGRGLEFLAALVVNIPGFPIPRPEARIVASAAGEEEVLALVAAGMVTEEDVEGMGRREYLRKIGALT